MKGPATAADVAAFAGVDRSTVSRVLRGDLKTHRYAPDTVKRVRRAAHTLGYRPSRIAQALRTGKTRLVGLLVADIANPFFGQIARHVERELGRHAYRLLICNTDQCDARQAEHIHDLIGRGVDGLLVAPTGAGGLRKAASHQVPLVLLDRPATRGVRFVGLDNIDAGRQLGDLLQQRGYTDVMAVRADDAVDATLDLRYEGLAQSLAGVARLRRTTVQAMPTIHPQDHNVRAMVALNNDAAIAIYRWVRHHGHRIPADIGVAAFDDFPGAELLSPALTVIAQPMDQIAAQAVSRLVGAMAGDTSPADAPLLLKGKLIIRDSLRPS